MLSVLAGTLWSFASGGGFGIELLGLKVFPIVILGGLDSLPGTIIAALVVGILRIARDRDFDPDRSSAGDSVTPRPTWS